MPRWVENATGNVFGGSASNRTDRRRYMGEWTANYFKDNFLGTVARLGRLKAHELTDLTFAVDPSKLGSAGMPGIF